MAERDLCCGVPGPRRSGRIGAQARPACRAGLSSPVFPNRPAGRTGLGSLRDVTEPEDRDERITALEADVAALRSRLGRAEQDAAAARILAGGADRDVSDLRGEFREFRDQNNRVLSAMRADLTDGFTEMRAEMRKGFATAAVGQQRIVDLLDVVMRQLNDRPEA